MDSVGDSEYGTWTRAVEVSQNGDRPLVKMGLRFSRKPLPYFQLVLHWWSRRFEAMKSVLLFLGPLVSKANSLQRACTDLLLISATRLFACLLEKACSIERRLERLLHLLLLAVYYLATYLSSYEALPSALHSRFRSMCTLSMKCES